jgi:phosphoenolpyruvate synthase/pyruvate phosphate dikinase
MWGTLVECGQRVAEINNDTGYRNEVKGWRAEFAYPKRLMTENADLAAQLQDDYGVPCEVGRAIDIYNELLRRAQP